MIEHLTLARSGKFTVSGDSIDAQFQCGLPGQREFRYHVTIIASAACLTREGFVVNNQLIQQYFDDHYNAVTVLPSCERMAVRACEDLAVLVGDGVQKVEVTMDGTPQAGLTAFWTREDGAGVGCLYPRTVQDLASAEVLKVLDHDL